MKPFFETTSKEDLLEYAKIIADECNVKEVIFNLDEHLTMVYKAKNDL